MGKEVASEVTLHSSVCRCVVIRAWSNNPSKRESTVTSVLFWDAVFPVCGQAWTNIRGRRRERIAELGKNVVFCWCLQDPGQMVSHRWMLWAGRSATTAIALVAGSFLQLTVWPGQLCLYFFLQTFPSLGSSGWLITACWMQHSQPQDGWKAEQDGEKRQIMEEELWGKRRQDNCTSLCPCPCSGCDWEGRQSVGISWSYFSSWYFRSRRALLLECNTGWLAPAFSRTFLPPSSYFFRRQTQPFTILSHYFWCIF